MIPPASDPPTDPSDPIRRRLAAFRVLAETGDSVADQIAALEDQLRAAEFSAAATNSPHAQVVAGIGNTLVSNWIETYIELHVDQPARTDVQRLFNEYLLDVWDEQGQVARVAGSGVNVERMPLAEIYVPLDVTASVQVLALEDEGGHRIRPLVVPLPGRWDHRATLPNGQLVHVGMWLGVDQGAEVDLMRRVLRDAAHVSDDFAGDAKSWRERGVIFERRVTALEAMATASRRVIIGAPGAGKSTLARYLALCMAGEHLQRSDANLATLNHARRPAEQTPASNDDGECAWHHGTLLPIFVELRRFAAAPSFPSRVRDVSASSLLRYLVARDRPRIDARLEPHFSGYLQDGQALLILDGLDEVREAADKRLIIRAVIERFMDRYRNCRVIVTSRPYAYAPGSEWRLDDLGFHNAELADLDDHQIESFARTWHMVVAAKRRIAIESAERRADRLIHRLAGDARLRPLAVRPLMLSMIADLHAGGSSLPTGRAALYEQSTRLLLDRWNELEEKHSDRPIDVPDGEGAVRSMHDILDLSLEDVLRALERLAFQVHSTSGAASAEAANIDLAQLLKALALARPKGTEPRVSEKAVVDYLAARSGILVCESDEIYRFPHRSYQEYLAARHLAEQDFPRGAVEAAHSNPELWRETVRFLFGHGNTSSAPAQLLATLLPTTPAMHVRSDDPLWHLVIAAALGVEDSVLWPLIVRHESLGVEAQGAVNTLKQHLIALLTRGGLTAADRAVAGRILAALGDDRPGVHLHADGVPDIAWIALPGGTFTMGSDVDDPESYSDEKPKQTVAVHPFRIAKYPVTVAQYRPFVADHPDRVPVPWDDTDFTDDNQPVVSVTWHDAIAFCAWLSERRRERVRLPTEAEWEYAARGTDGRIYPWGRDFNAERCNTAVSGILRTTAVGMYPLPDGYWTARPHVGEDPLDMSGNVWEWTSTRWRDQLDRPADDSLNGTMSRVVRGGSWYVGPRFARSASRSHFGPDYAWSFIGFRVAAPSS